MFSRSAILFACAAVPAIVGFPSMFAELRQLAEALGMPPTEWHLWNYLMVYGGLFGMAIGSYGMAKAARRWFAQRKRPTGTHHAVDAHPVSHHWRVSQPTVTLTLPPWTKPILRLRSIWRRRMVK